MFLISKALSVFTVTPAETSFTGIQEKELQSNTLVIFWSWHGMSVTAGNLTNKFWKCWIYPYNPDILADDVFKCKSVSAPNGGDPVCPVEDILDPLTPSSTASLLKNWHQFQWEHPKVTAVTSAPFREKQTDSRQKSGKKTFEMKKNSSCHSEWQAAMDAPSYSSNINHNKNYCGVCNSCYSYDKAGEKWVKCLRNCGIWFQ